MIAKTDQGVWVDYPQRVCPRVYLLKGKTKNWKRDLLGTLVASFSFKWFWKFKFEKALNRYFLFLSSFFKVHKFGFYSFTLIFFFKL